MLHPNVVLQIGPLYNSEDMCKGRVLTLQITVRLLHQTCVGAPLRWSACTVGPPIGWLFVRKGSGGNLKSRWFGVLPITYEYH